MRFDIKFDENEVLLLQIWAQHVSQSRFVDPLTQGESQKLLERIKYTILAQCPEWDLHLEYGDFR